MGLKIWKPTCPSCGKGLKIQKGQICVQCEQCDSSLIIEGWGPDVIPFAPVGGFPSNEYASTGTFGYLEEHPYLKDDDSLGWR